MKNSLSLFDSVERKLEELVEDDEEEEEDEDVQEEEEEEEVSELVDDILEVGEDLKNDGGSSETDVSPSRLTRVTSFTFLRPL